MKRLACALAALAIFCAFAPSTTPTITASWITICEASTERFPNITFAVSNTGANPFTACRVQAWAGPTATDWKDISTTWAECTTLAASASSLWSIAGNSYLRLRVQVQSTAGTSAYCKPSGDR